jgi:alkylation response protein AidB-like acyl-CoA dehydrogenase
MDLAFTPEEQQFREDIRAWVHANLPADIQHKVRNALRQTRDDMQRWAKILGKKGWLGHGWPGDGGTRHHGVWQCGTTATLFARHCQR